MKPSTLSSKQKGEITENRAAEIITLTSGGYLSCFRPILDDFLTLPESKGVKGDPVNSLRKGIHLLLWHLMVVA
jgi:hypothetical protein